MVSSFYLLTIVIGTVFATVDYLTTCGTPECEIYNDGCNTCSGCTMSDDGTALRACTEMACFWEGIPSCIQCEQGSYYLRYFSYQVDSISCASRDMMVVAIAQNSSRCGCPSSHPYWYEGNNANMNDTGCIADADCPSSMGNADSLIYPLSVGFFKYPDAVDYGCPITYKTCRSDRDCATEFPSYTDHVSCYRPNVYSTCVPLYCNLDSSCDLKIDDGCSMDVDCMGYSYGYCVLDKDGITSTPTNPAEMTTSDSGGAQSETTVSGTDSSGIGTTASGSTDKQSATTTETLYLGHSKAFDYHSIRWLLLVSYIGIMLTV